MAMELELRAVQARLEAPGFADQLGRYFDAGSGLCQMPCPEQRARGGVRQRYLLRLDGRRALRWRLVRRVTLAEATAWTLHCLDAALRSRGLAVAYREHDLVADLIDAGAVAS